MNTTFELTFYVSDIPIELANQLVDDFDAMTGQEHDGRYFVTLEAPGRDCLTAAKTMHTQLCTLGLQITRLVVDLATRPDIAERLGVTRQAVSNWTRGVREGGDFPDPINSVAGGVWLWGDVNRWAIEHNKAHDDGVGYPTLADLDQFNGWLQGPCRDPWKIVEAHTAGHDQLAKPVVHGRPTAWAVETSTVQTQPVDA